MKTTIITLGMFLFVSGSAYAQQSVAPADSTTAPPLSVAAPPPTVVAPPPPEPQPKVDGQVVDDAELEKRAHIRHEYEVRMQQAALGKKHKKYEVQKAARPSTPTTKKHHKS